MAIPTYDQFIFPLLKVLEAHPDGIRSQEVYQKIAEMVGLTDEDRARLLPSGRQPVYQNRVGWANDRLKRAGLAASVQRGLWQLTEKGRSFVAEHPGGIDEDTLHRLSVVPAGSAAAPPQDVAPPNTGAQPAERQSPDELIDAAVEELHESLSAELLQLVGIAPPTFFEQLVLDVLHAMGYGAKHSDLERAGASGDGGIDGIITLDRLGLEKVYVQAKRWSTGTVGRPEIQKFFGALAGRRATRGVFITTSSFSADAKEYARQVSDSLVLIDGRQLASLMIEYGVGVAVQRTIKIAKVDTDYFEE